MLIVIGIHSEFSDYQNFLIDFSTNVLVAQISLMGVLITALALMVTILDNSDYVKSINDLKVEKNVDNLLDDFPLISILIFLHIILSIILIFFMKSNLKLVPANVFYGLLTIYIYIFMNILVRVSLISSIMVSVFKGIRNLMKLSQFVSLENNKHKKVPFRKQAINRVENRVNIRNSNRKRSIKKSYGERQKSS